MEFEPTEYARKPFNVKAEEVTYENIEAVSKWCKGRVDTEATRVIGGNEIKLPVIKFQGQGEDRGKELIARLGYFVVYSKGRFRVYKAPQFHAAFEKPVVWESNDHESDCDKQHQGEGCACENNAQISFDDVERNRACAGKECDCESEHQPAEAVTA